MSAESHNGTRQRRVTNGLLAAIVALLAFHAADRIGATSPSVAHASGDPVRGMVSAASQRKQMIADLKSVNGRLTSIEKMLQGELRVRVTDMPAIELPASDAGD